MPKPASRERAKTAKPPVAAETAKGFMLDYELAQLPVADILAYYAKTFGNPAGAAKMVREAAAAVRLAHEEGDDLEDLEPITGSMVSGAFFYLSATGSIIEHDGDEYVLVAGQSRKLDDVCRELGITSQLVLDRIASGQMPIDALTDPVVDGQSEGQLALLRAHAEHFAEVASVKTHLGLARIREMTPREIANYRRRQIKKGAA